MLGGGGGGFSVCKNFFFRLIPSARIFVAVVFQKKKTLNKGFFKKVVLCGLGMIPLTPCIGSACYLSITGVTLIPLLSISRKSL